MLDSLNWKTSEMRAAWIPTVLELYLLLDLCRIGGTFLVLRMPLLENSMSPMHALPEFLAHSREPRAHQPLVDTVNTVTGWPPEPSPYTPTKE